MKSNALFVLVAVAGWLAIPAWGQKASQTVTLSSGWNAVNLRVAPEESADTLFKNWPVQEVYKVLDTSFLQTSQFSTDLNEEGVPRAAFATWSRTGDRRLSFTGVAEGVYLCYSTSPTNVSVRVLGTPSAPLMPWHRADSYTNSLTKASYNFFGVSMASGASIACSNYMAGADFLYQAIGKIGGTSLVGPSFLPSLPGNVTKVQDGAVLALDASKVSDWPGALEVAPRTGLLFGDARSQLTLSIKNRSSATTQIRVAYTLGEEPSPAPLLPLLYWNSATNAWTNFPSSVTISNVGTNQTAVLHLAFDRKTLNQTVAAGEKKGGILTITDMGASKMLVKLPVSALSNGTNDLARADWPAGLWVGEMDFDHVGFYRADGALPEDLPSGGKMRVRAILHVDVYGAVRLLQRVTLASSTVTNESSVAVQTELYAGTQTLPTGSSLTRISAAAMDIDSPVVETAGTFGAGTLAFAYTIQPAGRSNPFHHPFHPDHDGLNAYFDGPAPSGDELSNYSGSVKPETFSIGNVIEFTWAAGGGTAAAWSPEEVSSGTCVWRLKNVRRQGDVVAHGTFQLKRISPVGVLHLP